MSGHAVSPSQFRHLRRWSRHRIDVPIRVVAAKDEKAAIVPGRGRDISEGGMMVFAGVELKAYDVIEIEFTPPFGGPLRVAGIVKNREGYYYGIEFLRETQQDTARSGRLREVLHGMVGGFSEP